MLDLLQSERQSSALKGDAVKDFAIGKTEVSRKRE